MSDRSNELRTRSAPAIKWAIELAIVAAIATLLAVVLTWPLVTELGSSAHHALDPPFQAWTIDWVQHAITSPASLFDANIYAPEKTTLAYSDSLIGIAVPLLPLRGLGVNPIAQLNFALLGGFALSAVGAYVFGMVSTGSRIAASVIGVAYAFGPFGTLHAGHLQMTMRAGVPLAAAAAWVLVDRARDGRRLWPAATALAAVIVWQGTISFYPTTYALGAAAAVLAVRWRSLGRRGMKVVALSLGVTALALAVLAIPYLVVHARYSDFDRPLSVLSVFGADFTTTDPRLSIWGPLLGRGEGWPAFVGSTFPGAALLTLVPIGFITAWRAGIRHRQIAITGAALVGVGAFMALGTSDHGWRRFSPYRLLYEVVPGVSGMRATGRAWAIGVLGLGVLAGLGACWITGAVARRMGTATRVTGVLVASVVMVVILAEGFAPWTGLATIRVSEVSEELARLPGSGGVVYLPVNSTGTNEPDLGFANQAQFVYESTAHHRQIVNGYTGYVPQSWLRISKTLLVLPDERALAELRNLDVRYVVVTKAVEGGPWAPLRDPAQAGPLEYLGTYGTAVLYEVPPARGSAGGER